MISRLIPLLIAAVSVTTANAAEQHGQLDASEALFTVLAAANAAGYDAGLATSPPLRQQVRDRIAASQAPVVAELRAWYHDHRQPDKTMDLARFVSLGLSVNTPDFNWSKREVETPPDAMQLNEFRLLLPRFYIEAKIADLWKQSQRAIDAALERDQEPIVKAVSEVNAYLRNPASQFLGRRFQIFVDFLGASNQVQTRSYGDDTFVVLTPASQPPVFAVRHAYFRYVIDPLAIKYGMDLKEKASLLELADDAPLLREQYRTDFGLLATECLIKAIESRMNSNPSMVDEAVREGYILTPFFNEQLALYEKQPQSMKLFFPAMVAALNVKHETKRLAHVTFATEFPQQTAVVTEQRPQITLSLAAQSVEQGDRSYYDKQDLDSARKLYERALEQPGTPTEHSKAFYGLAHIALRQKDPETADQYFRKTLESSPDSDTQAWTCYYLGMLSAKLSAAATANEEAHKWFQEVLAVKGAPTKAVESARLELAKLSAAEKQPIDPSR